MNRNSMMTLIRAEDVMIAPAVISANASLREAAARLEESAGDALLVLGAGGRVAGLLRMRELVMGAQAVEDGEVDRVGNFASRRFVRTSPEENLHAVLRRMRRHAQHAVVEEDGTPVGLISVRRDVEFATAPVSRLEQAAAGA